jgi:ABC transport system ATP-binding/permease protein
VAAPSEQPGGARGLTDGLTALSARGVSGVFSGIHEAVGQRTRIGRDLQNDIVVDDPLVSRFHAELRARSDGRRELVDLGSRNGTFVNGRAGRARLIASLTSNLVVGPDAAQRNAYCERDRR